MPTRRVSPAVAAPLKEALATSYWYKRDLRRFLEVATGDPGLIARLEWEGYKRQVVSDLVDALFGDQHRHFDSLVRLIVATAEIVDFSHLLEVEDGKAKADKARTAVTALRAYADPYISILAEEEKAAQRRELDRLDGQRRQALTASMGELRERFAMLHGLPAQKRGYALETLLNDLFTTVDIAARGPFRTVGEQIDGAFSHDGTEFLLEAKWQTNRTPLTDLEAFAGKVRRKLDNTLGLFLAMNGFEPNALDMLGRGGRPAVVCMDGGDLALVLEGRVGLPELLTRKRQHAARTGEVFVPASRILSGDT